MQFLKWYRDVVVGKYLRPLASIFLIETGILLGKPFVFNKIIMAQHPPQHSFKIV